MPSREEVELFPSDSVEGAVILSAAVADLMVSAAAVVFAYSISLFNY